MHGQKRGRACVACASIKIKCQLGSDTSLEPPCERCVRLNKDCILAAPKRQKDRVAELEAQVATLTRLLEAQGIRDDLHTAISTNGNGVDAPSAYSTTSLTTTDGGGLAKKRRLSLSSASTPSADVGASIWDTSRIDEIVSRDMQQKLVDKYTNEIAPRFPIVPLDKNCSLDALRTQWPILLQAIIYITCADVLPVEAQEDVATTFLGRLPKSTTAEGERLLDLLQGVEVACLWFRSPKRHKVFGLFELIQTASGFAAKLGMAGPLSSPTSILDMPSQGSGSIQCNDAWRNWLVCHLLSVNRSFLTRKPMEWEEYTHQCILYLEMFHDALPSDRWLAQYFRAEHLCERIIHTMELTVLATHLEISDAATAGRIQSCRNYVRDWKALVPVEIRTPTVTFLEHLATVYTYEVLLHTPTNKQTFAAPYAPAHLSASDFPSPLPTPDLITAAYELLSGLHASIDAYCNIDASVLAIQPGSIFAARVSYIHYLLAKLYIACSAPGNSFGSILDISLLCAEEYADKLIAAMHRVNAIAPGSSAAKILQAAPMIKNFYHTYHASLAADNDLGLQALQFSETTSMLANTGVSPSQAYLDFEAVEWNDSSTLQDGFGLDLLFTDPQALELMSYRGSLV